MGVMIDEPGGDGPTIGIDDARGGCIELAHPNNLPLVHRHVCLERRSA